MALIGDLGELTHCADGKLEGAHSCLHRGRGSSPKPWCSRIVSRKGCVSSAAGTTTVYGAKCLSTACYHVFLYLDFSLLLRETQIRVKAEVLEKRI